MNRYRLEIHKIILKDNCENFIPNFYLPDASFHFFPTYADRNAAKVYTAQLDDRHRWLRRRVYISYNNTRELSPIAYDLKVGDLDQLSLQFNLVQQLETDQDNDWELLEDQLNDHTTAIKESVTLRSIRLAEIVLPAVLLEAPTRMTIESDFIEFKFSIEKMIACNEKN